MIIEEEVYLEHWGVKGMRWGVRNKGVTEVPRSTDPVALKEVIKSGTKITTMLLASGAGILALAMIIGGHQNAVNEELDFNRYKDRDLGGQSGSW
jgi:hypothetical protein